MVYFQNLEIDWGKANKEFKFTEFDSLESLEKNQEYLYRDQLVSVIQWIKKHYSYNEHKDNQSNVQGSNNILSIVGNRGSGKSSFLNTITYTLGQINLFGGENKAYVLPKIDPTIFNGHLDIIELFVAMLKKEVDKKIKKESRTDDNFFLKTTAFNESVNSVFKVLKNRRIDKSAFSEKNSGIGILNDIQKQQNFNSEISVLIENFLLIISTNQSTYKQVVLQIDDLDLVPNRVTNIMLQNINQFLKNQPKLVILIAYREEQLLNSHIDSLILDNGNLLDRKEITMNELREQSANFLEKILPKPQRVILAVNNESLVKEILSPFEIKNESDEEKFDFGNKTISAFIREIVMQQSRIQVEPVDYFEFTSFVYPNSLRSILQYLEILHNLKNYQLTVDEHDGNTWENDDLVRVFQTLILNIKELKKFFLSKSNEVLFVEDSIILNEWMEREAQSKNAFICSKLINLIEINQIEKNNEDKLPEYLRIIKYKQTYNVSLGDVFSVIEAYKEIISDDERKLHFLYNLKLMYSIENLLSFLEITTDYYSQKNVRGDLSEQNLDKYTSLVRGKIIPDNYYYNEYLISNKTSLEYNDFTKNFSKQITYSDVTAFGEVRIKGEKNLPYTERWAETRYRNFFQKKDYTKSRNYLVDPYSQLTDYTYLMDVVKSFEISDDESFKYFYYSMFDLDLFIRKNYSRQSSDTAFDDIYYTLGRINTIFTNDLSTPKEIEMRDKFSVPLLLKTKNEAENKFLQLFDDSELNIISDFKFAGGKKDVNIKNINKKQLNIIDDLLTSREKLLEMSVEPLTASETKSFYRSYKEIYDKWPDSLNEKEQQRIEDMTKEGNRKRISGIDEAIVEKLRAELKEEQDK